MRTCFLFIFSFCRCRLLYLRLGAVQIHQVVARVHQAAARLDQEAHMAEAKAQALSQIRCVKLKA